jgi:RHS repeat-associated protein
LLQKLVTCYNVNFSNCSSSIVNPPITQIDRYTYLTGLTSPSLSETLYNTGLVVEDREFDFGVNTGAAPTTTPLRATMTTYASLGSNILNRPACLQVTGGNSPSSCGTVTGTTNSITLWSNYSSQGNAGLIQHWISGSTYATQGLTYYPSGLVKVATDLGINAQGQNQTTYTYGACNGSYLTNVAEPMSLSYSMTWDCIGEVPLSRTDENSRVTTYTYNDPFWRVTSLQDPLLNTTSYNYTPTTSEAVMNFNGGVSTSDTLITTDGLGRQIFKQTRQGPGLTTFDSVQTSYGWASAGPFTKTSLPYSGTVAQPAPTGTGSATTQSDAVNRPISVSDTGGGLTTSTYPQNDVLSVLSPAPNGENNKQLQTQYDGLGRPTSSCAISSTVSGNVSCGQNTNTSAKGVLTTISYTAAASGQTVSLTRGSQTRSSTIDGLGRVIQKVTPEGGTRTYIYDTNSSCPSGYRGSSGQLASVSDPNGNLLCYSYDALARVTGVNANGTTCRHFYYDNSSGYSGTIPTGVSAPTNPNGRMVEAATDSCSSGTLITDEWFSYDKNGNVTDQWQWSPHSTQYYHSKATFAGNGKVLTLQLASPSSHSFSYGLDGEGRWSTLTDTTDSTPFVTGTTFNAAGQPTLVNLTGTTPDNDSYTYDPNTGLMTQFKFTVGNTPASLIGNLTWSANRTLAKLAITDGFNAGGTQTCNFNPTAAPGTGYDDIGRLVGMACGSSGWGQTYSYDLYDNLTKAVLSGHTGTAWNPGYSSSTNHYLIGSYDSNGDVTNDTNNAYYWNEFSKMKSVANGGGMPTCGTSGSCITYDAFGRIVETSNGSVWTERWITQLGETVYMSGTTVDLAFFPTGGGGVAATQYTYFSPYYHHKDWLGSARVESYLGGGNTVTTDKAYTPYGEMYAAYGYAGADVFAGITGLFDPGVLYDAPNRELSIVGRWLSPDPAGSGWNQYAYPTNPNSFVDPLGLECVWDDGSYDSEFDRQTGSVGGCGAAGGTWVELGQNGNWSGQADQWNQNLVASIQAGQVGQVDILGQNGSTYQTMYNGGQTTETVTPDATTFYSYGQPVTSVSQMIDTALCGLCHSNNFDSIFTPQQIQQFALTHGWSRDFFDPLHKNWWNGGLQLRSNDTTCSTHMSIDLSASAAMGGSVGDWHVDQGNWMSWNPLGALIHMEEVATGGTIVEGPLAQGVGCSK